MLLRTNEWQIFLTRKDKFARLPFLNPERELQALLLWQ
jgi:hypothetical protein